MSEEIIDITPQDEGDDQEAAVGAELSLEQLKELEELEKEQADESDPDST